MENDHQTDPLTFKVIGCAIEVHKQLGRSLLESAYRDCLLLELRDQGLKAEKEVPLQLTYKGQKIKAFYADILVEGEVILELKSTKTILEEHVHQTLTYLEAAKLQRGLILNFKAKRIIDGIRRVSNFNRDAYRVTEHELEEAGLIPPIDFHLPEK